MDWIETLILGVVQGVTEFLPISSDGHLALFQNVFDLLRGRAVEVSSEPEKLFVDVMLHVGTLAAILVHYRRVGWTGARGLLGAGDVPDLYRRNAIIRLGLLAFVATLPLIPDKLFFMDYIKQAFQSLRAIGVGFLITAAVLLVTVRLRGGEKGPREITWLDALLVGIAQMFAPLPGVSRSGLTVATALALGFSRTWAVQFSFLIAVPAILGATVMELKDLDPASLSGDRVAQIAAATVVAGLVGYMAIVWLVRIVRSGRLWYFSVYLVVLGGLVLAMAPALERRRDGRDTAAVERADRGQSDSPGAGRSPR
jgi:undecaprenyl-diphosphatase